MRVYGYFILPDGSVCQYSPNLLEGCGVVAATSKRAAEMSMPYLDISDIYAEIMFGSHRILIIRSGVLSSKGLNQHLYLGMDTSQRVEVIDVGSHHLAWAIVDRLRSLKSWGRTPVVSIKKSGRIKFNEVKSKILEYADNITEENIHQVECILKS